jgi:hypothetical protein
MNIRNRDSHMNDVKRDEIIGLFEESSCVMTSDALGWTNGLENGMCGGMFGV